MLDDKDLQDKLEKLSAAGRKKLMTLLGASEISAEEARRIEERLNLSITLARKTPHRLK